MAGGGFFVNECNLTEPEVTKMSMFLSSANVSRAKEDKPSLQPEEACKYLLATNFDVNAALELMRNYEKYYVDYDIASVSASTKPIETAWYNRKIWNTERRDKDGSAIVFFEAGLTDAGNDQKSVVQTLFLVLGEASKSPKTQRNGMVVLMDLHDATLTSIDHGLMRLIFKVVFEVYPLLVKSLFLIDVPLWFKLKQKVLDYFLNNQAKHKIKIVSRVELTKILPAQSVPTTLGGSSNFFMQKNLNWLNVMADQPASPSTSRYNGTPLNQSVGGSTHEKRVPLVPRGTGKYDATSVRAHPFATEVQGNTSPSSRRRNDPARFQARPVVPQPYNSTKQSHPPAPNKSNGIASKMISNWEERTVSKKVKDPTANKDQCMLNSSGNVADLSSNLGRFLPSDTLKINWRDSAMSVEGEYANDWLDGRIVAPYENMIPDKTIVSGDQRRSIKQHTGNAKNFSMQPGSSDGYEVVTYHDTLTKDVSPPVKPPTATKPPTAAKLPLMPNKQSAPIKPPTTVKPMPAVKPIKPPTTVSPAAVTNPSPTVKKKPFFLGSSKPGSDYVNVEIPSDTPSLQPPPVPKKRTQPPSFAAAAASEQSGDDSEPDEEEGNESRYENWSFFNPNEGDQDMGVTELEGYVKSRKLEGLKAEYFKIRNKPEPAEMKICKIQCNIKKNRYKDVGCLDRNRVKLNRVKGKEGSDYIHANYADGYNASKEFILTQGPLKCTVDDFWRMIWEQNTLVIVMLTRCVELNRIKCTQYWPESGTVTYGDFTVESLQSEEVGSCNLHTFRLRYMEEEHFINHFQFATWPDYGVPSSGSDILLMIQVVRDRQSTLLKRSPSIASQHPPHGPPIVVHCSAGVGRTGTFCTVDYCIRQLLDIKRTNIQSCVKTLRTQRAFAIQTEDQYHFCYKCILEFAKNYHI